MRATITKVYKGGKGSGHHGHSGRPGKHGGSLPGSGGSSSVPRNESEVNMLDTVKQYANLRRPGMTKDEISSFDQIILDHGEFFDPPQAGDELPKWCEQGATKECYYNATMQIVVAPDGVFYTEGYAFTDGIEGFPFQHAWLTTAEGKVIDPTWKPGNGTVYYGVKLSQNYVIEQTMESGVAGIIVNDYMFDFDIGRNGFPEGALVNE